MALTSLRVLLVEDSEDDAELILHALRSGGYSPHWRRVDTALGMRAALDEAWDIIVADYKMPGFSGLEALRLRKERTPDTPFILASGVIGEEAAVEAMRAGADDYVMKRNLARLPPAVARELRDAEMRRRRRRAEEALERQSGFTRALWRSIGEGVCTIDVEGRVTFANPAAQRLLGFNESELVGRDLHDIAHPGPQHVCPILEAARSRSSYHTDEDLMRRKDGGSLPVSLTVTPLGNGTVQGAVLAFQDVSERKRSHDAERFLAHATESLAELLDYERALERVAALCVPEIADLCAVVVADQDHTVTRVINAGAKGATLTHHPIDATGARLVSPRELSEVHAQAPPELLDFLAAPPGGRPATERAEPLGSLQVALRSRGRTLGSLILLRAAGRCPLDPELAQQLAQRAAMAIDNARLYDQAQQAIRVREEFLSIASHELRTPLTPLRLHLHDLLRRARSAGLAAQPPDIVTTRLESASRQVDRVSRLVSNLLDVTRIVSGHVSLEREQVDLAALVREVLERADPEVQRGNYRIQLETTGAVIGSWDRLRIDQVVTNLVSNALKYGQGRPVDIKVTREGGRARLSVRDHGIGIPSDQLERIFGRFERAASERTYGGLGLGLYIVRRFVEAHGGLVRVESPPGEGATFTVELPLG
jgi:PAS domain S-box-containing protein